MRWGQRRCGGRGLGEADADRRTADHGPSVEQFEIQGAPSAVAVARRDVWVVLQQSDSVLRLDPESGAAVGEPVPVGNGPTSAAADGAAVWVTNLFDDTVSRIDAGAARAKPARTGERPLAVAAGEGSIWALNSGDLTVTQIDPETGKVRSTSPPILTRASGRLDYAGLAVGDGTVWVTDAVAGTVVRIDARTNKPSGTPIAVGLGPTGVAVGDGWPGSRTSATERSHGSIPTPGR